MRRAIWLILLAGLASRAWAIPIGVSFSPASDTVNLGDTFSVDIVADIPDPVLGWGLDLSLDSSILGLAAPPVIGSQWLAAPGLDGDGLSGLAFPTAVSGNDILLATLTLEALSVGNSVLQASVTPGDLTEGFALIGAFAPINFQPGSINVVVPAVAVSGAGPLWLMSVGLIPLARRVLRSPDASPRVAPR